MLGTIVVAESSRTVRRMVEISLAKHPCNLVFAADGAAALELVQTESPAMAIVDAALDGGGYDVAERIKSGSKTKVLLLVGRNHSFDAGRAQKAGIDAHIQKPFLTQQLVEKVFTALGQPVPDKAVFRSTTMTIPLARKKGGLTDSVPVSPGRPSSPGRPASKPALPLPTRNDAPPPPPPRGARSAAPAPPPPKSAPSVPAEQSLGNGRPSVAPVSAAAAPAPPSRAPQPPPMDAFTSRTIKQTIAKIAADPAIAAALNDASRETVEQVAWEVVPRLAEAILKEEIARLVRERLAS
ncbi:MAG: CheY-like chemotaxis protein [Bradymonadia bacterium]|jgi:CheY-like chemotaxis protein